MKHKEYIYYISYLMFNEENKLGFGRCEVILNHKIKTIKDITEIEKNIEKDKKVTVVLMNYKPLRVEVKENENME